MKIFKNLVIVTAAFILAIFMSCDKDQAIPQKADNSGYSQNLVQGFPAAGTQVVAVKNQSGEITGYYFSDNPSEVISIKESTEPILETRSSSIVNVAGDMDNFGYGGNDPLPCDFYDFSDPIVDLGIFDRELTFGDETESWTQDFTADANFCSNFEATTVTVEVREFFSDGFASTISIDGNVLNFTPYGYSTCVGAIVQTFTFTGAAASFANDGIINFIFSENGDDIAIDWVRVTVEGDCLNILIDGCDSGVENQTVDGSTMMELINECAENATNHGKFVSCVAALTNTWKKAGLITGYEKEAIMECAAESNLPE